MGNYLKLTDKSKGLKRENTNIRSEGKRMKKRKDSYSMPMTPKSEESDVKIADEYKLFSQQSFTYEVRLRFSCSVAYLCNDIGVRMIGM